MTASNDPWMSSTISSVSDVNEFDDNFVSSPFVIPPEVVGLSANVNVNKVDAIYATKYLSKEDYANKLEEKLQSLQKQKQPNGKDMLQNLKERKDFYLSEILQGLDIHYDDITMTSPSFLDRLYSTNGVYRHLNPQQALDSSEKEPFAKHDYLAKIVADMAQSIDGEVSVENVKV